MTKCESLKTCEIGQSAAKLRTGEGPTTSRNGVKCAGKALEVGSRGFDCVVCNKTTTKKAGKKGYCVTCYGKERKAYRDKWVRENSDKVRGYYKKYNAKGKRNFSYKEHYWSDPEKARSKGRRDTAKRRASKLNAVPSWLTDFDKFAIEEIYELAKQRSTLTGIEWHVDHIVPLQGKLVCGLHTPTNLQLMPATLNLRKSNSLKI